MPFSKSTVKFTGKFIRTVIAPEAILLGREHVEQEQVHQTASAQLCSG